MKTLYNFACGECSINAENEVLQEILNELREILQVPEKGDIIHHARKVMTQPAQPIRSKEK